MKTTTSSRYPFFLVLLAFCGTVDGGAQTNKPPQNIPSLGITALTPPYLELTPGPQYWPRVRIWQGIPGIERTPGGRLWATWYTGLLGEGKGQNYDVLVTSTDDGKTWSKPMAVYDPSRNFLGGDTGDPMLWIDPKGRMWWFVNRVMKVPNDVSKTCWGFYTDDPESPRPVWKGPVFAGYGGTLNKPLVLFDGTWLHMIDGPAYDKLGKPELKRGAHVYKFTDNDQAFEHVGYAAIKDTPFTEHMVVERQDKSLLMLSRTIYGITEAESKDGGKNWVEIEPLTRSFNINTRFFFRKLASGNWLLVVNDDPKARANMTALLSTDEGKTWSSKLVLDERDSVSYPDGVESRDGAIYVIYDRGRYKKDQQEILLARFTENDVKAGKLVDPASFLKRTVNKLADEGGGVMHDGETIELRYEFARLFPDSDEAKKERKLEESEKAPAKKTSTTP